MLENYLFLIELAATLYMTGLIWFVQIVHYPLFQKIDENSFVEYEKAHVFLTGFVVIIPMLAELFSCFLLLYLSPSWILSWEQYSKTALLVVVWLSTFLWQVPQHDILSKRYDQKAQKLLVRGNWARTIAWTLRAIILLGILVRKVN